jgi:protein SCO1/2
MDQTDAPAAAERPFRTLWVGVVLLALILGLAAVVSQRSQQLPLPVISTVGNFTLTNQLGQAVTLDNLRGRVWLADIIFTRCPGPCPRMTRQMAELQAALPARSKARLVTLTTDPEFDTPAVLQKYAGHYQADPARWQFLTGTKLEIAGLAIDGLKLTTVDKPPETRTSADDLFIHSTIFVLVDKQGQLRASFDTSSEILDWPEVRKQILSAIKQLEREP